MATTTKHATLPSGSKIFSSFPEVFFIPEFVLGGIVWILAASVRAIPSNPLGWVMFVSIFCFVMTALWFFIFLFKANKKPIWVLLDVCYHFLAVVCYLSAAVVLSYITILKGRGVSIVSGNLFVAVLDDENVKIYRIAITAVVMSYGATLLYFLHTIFSAIRWKKTK